MSISTMAAPPEIGLHGVSSLTKQLEEGDGERTPRSSRTYILSSPKPRSLSDAPKPTLSPSPAFREPTRRVSKDDSAIIDPVTPRRPSFHVRGLSLQMTAKDGVGNTTSAVLPRVPLSPKLDSSHIYGSPSSMLPRRSRGLDYTRACTNLHHSTLAESSPDASPIAGRGGIQIPQRRSLGNTVLDSPSNMSGPLWSTIPDKSGLSGSISSVNMLDSDSDSDTSSDDMALDRDMDDPVLTTPAASRLNPGLVHGVTHSPGGEWMSNQPSPAQASLMSFHSNLMSFRRARTRKGKSQHSSSSVSMNSSRPSPGPLSPGIIKSVESSGYFGPGLTKQQVQSRRESLSLGTDELCLSDNDDIVQKVNGSQSLSDMDGSNTENPRAVIRRAVTRRGNLLPKTKGFARIRAALLEESMPIDSEARREAEVIRQVQENDPAFEEITSPVINPSIPFSTEGVESSIEDNPLSHETSNESRSVISSDSFSRHVEKHSAGLGFWNAFDERYRTPPPSLRPRESSAAISDDVMDTPGSWLTSDNPTLKNFNRSRSRSTTPLAPPAPPTAADVVRRMNNKRRREDDFDQVPKRRAISPAQSSPVMPQSPIMTNDKPWGKPPAKSNGERSNSGGNGGMNGLRKVGLQGITETNEGIMSMTID